MVETVPAHLLVGFLGFIPCLWYYQQGKVKPAFLFLLATACLLRLVMIGLDPYLHIWDEQYHAVAAKSMMTHPFIPALRNEPLLPYTMTDWCCNYIWLHKQPLFLWQMAISMKIFGVNTVALRLPNAIIGTLILWPVFRIGQIWTGKTSIAFLGAFFYALSFQVLELTSGRLMLDHNDIMFGYYVTGSIWAFCEYIERPGWKWALVCGILAGGSILVKWLTGLLVYGGWGIFTLLNKGLRNTPKAYFHIAGSIVTCIAVFLPWQIYIQRRFPAESAATYAYYKRHIFDDLGHPGDSLFHIKNMDTAFGVVLIPFLLTGLWTIWQKPANRSLGIAMAAMFIVVYLFFSLIVATKMPGFTFPVAVIGFIWIATGFDRFLNWLSSRYKRPAATVALGVVGILSMQSERIVQFRSSSNTERNNLIHNTHIYRSLTKEIAPEVVIFNCKAMEDPAVRFWMPNNAYQLFPESNQIDTLLGKGYKIAAFNHPNNQHIPDFWEKDGRIIKINLELK
jgi:4-amino-4-deoxy-L-arabinose transferase-like glycosyltransferase